MIDKNPFLFTKSNISTCLRGFIRKVFFWTAKLFWFALKERERIIIPFLENWKLKEPDRGRDGGGGGSLWLGQWFRYWK